MESKLSLNSKQKTYARNVYAFGNSQYGQLGAFGNLSTPTSVTATKEGIDCEVKIIRVGAGMSHTILLSEYGEMFVLGSNSKVFVEQCELTSRDN